MFRKSEAEEVLEKQYSDYKSQYELWKEKNSEAIGTPEYVAYVKQFQEWEKDVEKRRKGLKEKAEKEYREQVRDDELEKRLQQERDAEAAAAYAQSQQAYLAHHQMAIEEKNRHQTAAAAAAAAMHHHQLQQQQQQHNFARTPPIEKSPLNAELIFRELMSSVMSNSNGSAAHLPLGPPQAISAQQGGQQQQQPALWGVTTHPYDARDPLFARWGRLAAPAHVKPELRPPSVPVPCWMLIDKLKQRKMMLTPHLHQQPPPTFPFPLTNAPVPLPPKR